MPSVGTLATLWKPAGLNHTEWREIRTHPEEGHRLVDVVSGWDPGDSVTVTVRYPEDITILGMTMFSKDLVGRRTMRVEQ